MLDALEAALPDLDRRPVTASSRAAAPALRIALFTGNYDYIKDGVALTLNRLVRYLQSQAVPVLVFAPRGPAAAFESVGEIVTVPSVPIPLRPEYRISLGLPRAVRERLAAFRPTLVHIAVPDILGYRALRLAQVWALPVVASYHTRYDTYLKFYGLGRLEGLARSYLRRFYGSCDRVYPPSESMAAILRAEGIGAPMRIWSRGVDSDLFSPARRYLPWRHALGIGDGEVVIAFVGRLVKEKNVALLVDIFQALRRRGIPFRGMVVGDGPEAAAMKAALPDAIFTGFLHDENLARAYASSDVFLFPSESETFGNVTLEAMACGLPAVCADASGSRSLVIEGTTGYLASAASVDTFVDRLGDLVADDALRGRMGAAARRRALAFNWDHIHRGLHASYLEVLEAHAARVASGAWSAVPRPAYQAATDPEPAG